MITDEGIRGQAMKIDFGIEEKYIELEKQYVELGVNYGALQYKFDCLNENDVNLRHKYNLDVGKLETALRIEKRNTKFYFKWAVISTGLLISLPFIVWLFSILL